MTPAQLAAFSPLASNHFADIADACLHYDITTPMRQAMWLAQCAHESQGFTRSIENLNYNAAELLQTFGKYFTSAQAVQYAHDPEAIGSRVYANRMGNGDEASGDGYRYRGFGWIQITGKSVQRLYWQDHHLAELQVPAAISQYPDCIYSAAWFWQVRGCNEAADAGDFVLDTKLINGGDNGLADRQQWFDRARQALNIS